MSDGVPRESVSVERRGKVLVVAVDDGKANALSASLSRRIRAVVDGAVADAEVGAIVIAGRPGRFSAGFDLNVFQGGDAEAIREMVAVGGGMVQSLYGSRVPVVAACTGHAVAAGALMLLGCDRRVGPDADVTIDTAEVSPDAAAQRVILHLESEGYIGARRD